MRAPFLVAALAAMPAWAMDVTGSVSLAGEWRGEHAASPYFVAPPTVSSRHPALRQDLALRLQDGGLNAQFTFRVTARRHERPEHRGIVNQLYYDGDLGDGHGFTLGKKILSSGVGFGLRPLDVIQREDRRSLNPPPPVGVPLVAWEHFSADEAWTLAWTHPGRGRTQADVDDAAVVARYYRLAGATDLHGVVRLSRRHRLEAGAGFTRAVGEEASLHAAALYQRRHARVLNSLAEQGGAALAAADPMRETFRRDGLKAVAGAQWTERGGFGVLAEAWYDAEAYRSDEWRRLNALTARQIALRGLAPATAVDGNIAWSSRAYERPLLLRENLLLRLSYDTEGWKSALEVLATPRDGGRVLTASVFHEGNRQRIGGGVRWLGGAADSAYAQAPTRRMIFLEWRLALP